MENTRQPIPLRIRQHLRDAVGRGSLHKAPEFFFVDCDLETAFAHMGSNLSKPLFPASRKRVAQALLLQGSDKEFKGVADRFNAELYKECTGDEVEA